MALFHYDFGEVKTPTASFDLFLENFTPPHDEENILECSQDMFDQSLPFIKDIFFGVTGHQEELDRRLESASEHWRLYRMSRVDRNIMRMALFEMLFREEIPTKVSINEAIELGKIFGAEDSSSFINGVLDRINRLIEKNDVDTPEEEEME